MFSKFVNGACDIIFTSSNLNYTMPWGKYPPREWRSFDHLLYISKVLF